MPNIPFTTPMAYLGIFCLILGLFLLVAGMGIIQIEKVTVSRGRQTYITGLVLLAMGGVFLISESANRDQGKVEASNLSTPTAEPTRTPVSTQTATATPTEVVFTATVPVPTNTAEPTQTVEPSPFTGQVRLGNVIVEEYFSPPMLKWQVGETSHDASNASVQYIDGKLMSTITYIEPIIYLVDTPFGNIRDFDLSLDYVIDPSSSGDVGFCVMWRRKYDFDNKLYLGYSTCVFDKWLRTYYRVPEGDYQYLTNELPDLALTKDLGQTNHIQVVVKDSVIRVYVNGVKAGEYQDLYYENPGGITFGIQGEAGQKVTVSIDNIVMREVP